MNIQSRTGMLGFIVSWYIEVLVTYNFYNFNIQLTKLLVWLSEVGTTQFNTYDAVFSAEVKSK